VGQNKSNKKVANGLVAMSSAAVLAVYAAGYVRTRPAANRLAAQVYERPLVREGETAEAAPEPSLPPPSANRAPVAPVPVLPAHSEPKHTTVAAPAPAASAAPAPAAIPDQTTQTARTTQTVAAPSETAAVAVPASAPAAIQPSPAATPAAASTPVTPATTVTDAQPQGESQTAPATPPPPAPPVWKDGKYTAWGTCQHGDIQATVVIEGGRIISAEITNCQTRYSCDVIENLPAKVITRQKAKFDTVGGATESAYAYYGAVYWALDQASK